MMSFILSMKPIGSFTPENQFFLAPMEAVNCAAFRVLCRELGAGLIYTDMIDADLFFHYAKENSVEEAIKKFVNPQPDESPLAIQIGGAKSESLVFAINALEKNCQVIDFNIGCPLGYMLGKKGGAYLSKHPDQLYKLITTIRKATKKPLTVKMRSGWDDSSINAKEIALALEKLGVDAITLHPRTRTKEYRGSADWALAKSVADALTIPFILSGDVTNVKTARLAFDKVGCDYIMLGRAAQKNPVIFSDLEEAIIFKDAKPEQPQQSAGKKSRYGKDAKKILSAFRRFITLYHEREHNHSFRQLQDYTLWFSKECKNNKQVTQDILKATTEEQLDEIMSKLVF